MKIKHEDGRMYSGEPVWTYPFNVQPDSAIANVKNYRFQQAKYRYGIYDSVLQRHLGWSREHYYQVIRTEQPSEVEDILVRACLEVAERMPGTSRFRKTE